MGLKNFLFKILEITLNFLTFFLVRSHGDFVGKREGVITTSDQIITVELNFELPAQNRSEFVLPFPQAPNRGDSFLGVESHRL